MKVMVNPCFYPFNEYCWFLVFGLFFPGNLDTELCFNYESGRHLLYSGFGF